MMNIKRLLVVCLCVALSVSVTCSAVDYDAYYYPKEDGTYGHDTEQYRYDLAAEMLAERGFSLDLNQFWVIDNNAEELTYCFDFDAFQIAYDALIAALPVEAPPIDDGATAEDPLDGSSAVEPDVVPPDDELLLDEPLLDEPSLELVDDVFYEVLADDYSYDFEYTLNDLRGLADDFGVSETFGLKAVIRSIFGVYEPVTTTAVYTETVDGEVITSLVDVVAEGTAGVDWEYISGVALFGIVLFCMFKMLGGIVS